MLSQIVKEFKESGGAIDMAELGRRLGVEPSALDGMLEVLVKQGKLQRACATAPDGCGGSCRGCGYYRPGANMGSIYALVVPTPPGKKAK
ncbi:MAG: FeoC-like transcriptional regulator [Dehalococcoidia bacterium]